MFNSNKYFEIKENIENINKKTQIIAISKNHELSQVEQAISKNVTIFGENKVQEAIKKFEKIKKNNDQIKLHLTGPLQTNKVKQALTIFDVFHTLDREKLLKEFAKYPDKTKNKNFFIQVNTGKEESKSGIYPEKVGDFLELCMNYGLKKIEGLMCIPPIKDDPKKHFKLISDISKDLGLRGLSIGMSSDFMQALEFNPLYIRLGTILFGKRE
tara:strand:- start:531 stop:1169 length:639 start_codon:yes stop_codon:yes gene_type:complete